MILYENHSIAKLARVGDNARDWIFCPAVIPGESTPFERLCGDLNLEPDVVRYRIANMPEEAVRALRGLDFTEGDDE